jgi:nitrite reductase/ring-hydroxylating ferredoxin subunit
MKYRLKEEDIPQKGKAKRLEISGKNIALFHCEEGLFALDDHCPHRHGPLHEGAVENGCVTCPWHLWQFRLVDGTCTNVPGQWKAKTYPIQPQAQGWDLYLD